MSHLYKLRYQIEPGNFTKADIFPNGYCGLTDVLILGSVLHNEDGSSSTVVMTVDGRNNGEQITPEELWKFWTAMAYQLANDPLLSPGKAQLCAAVHATVKDTILRSRG